MFQFTQVDARYVLDIICFQFIFLNKSRSILSDCTRFISLLALPYAALLPICLFSFLAEFDNFTSAFSVSCTDQCKVSIKDNGHVILHMVVLTAQITDHCF